MRPRYGDRICVYKQFSCKYFTLALVLTIGMRGSPAIGLSTVGPPEPVTFPGKLMHGESEWASRGPWEQLRDRRGQTP